jgi:GT2 family glycosyltransferase
VRNVGAREAKGDVLIFLDADVTLTDQWARRLAEHTLGYMKATPHTVTGSWCDVPDGASWIQRFWFSPPLEAKPRHIGTAHLIATREIFVMTGGFDEELETGEDYDFCRRAQAMGAEIIDDPELRVVHDRYPQSLRAFVRREVWHGSGDFSSLKRVLKSKVALLSILFVTLHFAPIAAIVRGVPVGVAAGAGVTGVIGLCVASSFAKYQHAGLRFVLVNAFLYYFYFWARSFSAWYRIRIR